MKVVVIGGGISGLATAFRVQEGARAQGLPLALTVLEADPRLGGTLYTHQERCWAVEAGPNGFLTNKASTLQLVADLGLSHRLLPADSAAQRRFIYVGGRLRALPASPLGFLFSRVLPLKGKLAVLREPWQPVGPADETLAAFGTRRLGPAAVDNLLDPFVSGVFAGDPSQLSVSAAFPVIKALEREHGSLIRGMRARARARRAAGEASQGGGPAGPGGHLTSLKGGMGELIEGLAARLGDGVRRSGRVRAVERLGPGFRVHLVTGEAIEADLVISAAPAPQAASYLEGLSEPISSTLRATPYASIAVVATGFKTSELGHPLDGFGFLVPSKAQRSILGTLWSSSVYPGHRTPPGHVLMRTMVGGARNPALPSLDDDALLDLVRQENNFIMGTRWREPSYLRIIRWRQAIPQYLVGHLDRVARIELELRAHPGLFITGNHLRGVSVNDCTADAERTAQLALQALRRRVEASAHAS